MQITRLSYADMRQAHIDAAAATGGWSIVRRPGGRLIGRLVPFRVAVEARSIFPPFRTHWHVVPDTLALQAEAAAREKRQNREKF